jgi:hypothetical protein
VAKRDRAFAQTGSAAIVLSPLLNLARASGTGPGLNQSRPILPLGSSGLSGTAMLSLSPDRLSVQVRVQLNRAASVSIRLRRLTGDHPEDVHLPLQDELLVVELNALQLGLKRSSAIKRFSLSNRAACLPLPTSDLQKAGISLLGLTAASIQGIAVDPAPAAEFERRGARNRSAERMLVEIEAAHCTDSAVTACRHITLANLYARQLTETGTLLA